MSRLSIPLLLILISCGLTKPLADEDFKISPNIEGIARKQAYLAQKGKSNSNAPNIIWIIVDDLGMEDTDLYGKGTVPVPNLNKLADEGIRFANAYVTSPICGPSRAGIYTGRYNQRFGFEHQQHNRYLKNKLEYYGFKYFVNSKPWYPQKQDSVPTQAFIDAIGLPDSEITIADALKKYGYTTGLFGKWHVTKQMDKGPQAFGFDTFYGFLNSHSLYAPEDDISIISIHDKKDWTDKYIWRDQRDGLSAIQRDGEIIDEKRYLTFAITDEAIHFIDNTQSPYFAVLSYNAPHTPYQATQQAWEAWSTIKDPVKRVYAAMISTLDNEIGRLINHLEKTNQFENTLIFFISDNGGAEYTHATDNGEYKGGKLTDFEGGLKIPMFLYWPENIHGDRTYNDCVSSLDMFKTSLSVVTSENAPNVLDGADLIPSIKNSTPPHKYVFYRRGYNHSVRSDRYKLSWNSNNKDSIMFDLSKDPYEHNNILNKEAIEEKRQLVDAYNTWEKGMIPPAWPPMIDYKYVDEDGKTYWFEN